MRRLAQDAGSQRELIPTPLRACDTTPPALDNPLLWRPDPEPREPEHSAKGGATESRGRSISRQELAPPAAAPRPSRLVDSASRRTSLAPAMKTSMLPEVG